MVISAIDQYEPAQQRVDDDPMADRMLPPALRASVAFCRVPAFRRLMIAASERSVPGSWGSLLCRKRYADDQVTDALQSGIKQVVLLGAGFDTRSVRLVAPRGGSAYEVDLAGNTAAKRRRLMAVFGRIPDRVNLVPIDFERDDLQTLLAGAGFDPDARALFVWEAVTQYLTESAVRTTLQSLSRAAQDSRLIFTYVLKDLIDGSDLHGADGLYQRFVIKNPIWRFGLAPTEVTPLLGEYGWAVIEDVGPAEYADRYLKPAGRDLAVMEIERFVRATKVG
ncbi:MAG: SAM-dependent methyltransferase [Microlunatus sp.]|nr:SAM-dependent methyltransferase [Microlunatus sp.]